MTSVVGIVIDYGFGNHRDKGILSQEFAVSTAMDTVMAVGTGAGSTAVTTMVTLVLAAQQVERKYWGN